MKETIFYPPPFLGEILFNTISLTINWVKANILGKFSLAVYKVKFLFMNKIKVKRYAGSDCGDKKTKGNLQENI